MLKTHLIDGCITNAPLFIDEANENFQLEANSPAINTGSNLFVVGTADLAGNPRIQDGTVDMGAYENQQTRFQITTTVTGNGTIDPENPLVFQGADQTFSIQPAFGYYIQSLEVDGSAVAIATNYTFSNIQSPHTLEATFTTDPHTLTIVSGTGSGSYIIGTKIPIVANTPAAGYGFYEWTVEPSSYTGQLTNRYTASSLFTMPESNVTVTANYEILVTYADASRPDDSGDGMSWATAKKTIQAAIDTVGHNGTVWVADGTYDTGGSVTPGYSLQNRVCITRGITVRSVNGATATSISASGAMRGVFMETGTTLSGFTVINGKTLEYSGTENAYFDRSGAGIFLQSGCTVSNCQLVSNTADFQGGGADLYQGGTLNNCEVTDNYASYGGGIHIKGGTLNNCTIGDNRATYGGGLYMDGGTLNNSIVWGNSAGSGNNMYLAGITTIRNTCSSEGITDGVNGCVKRDPLFVNPTSDFRLQTTSPCIDAGDNTYRTTSTDLDGIPIPLDGNASGTAVIDIGCHEFASADADSDGDQMNDQGETIAGTNPLDPESFFSVNPSQVEVGGTNFFMVEWTSVPNRIYTVQWSTNLLSDFQTLETAIEFPQDSYTDTLHRAERSGFYMIDVKLK